MKFLVLPQLQNMKNAHINTFVPFPAYPFFYILQSVSLTLVLPFIIYTPPRLTDLTCIPCKSYIFWLLSVIFSLTTMPSLKAVSMSSSSPKFSPEPVGVSRRELSAMATSRLAIRECPAKRGVESTVSSRADTSGIIIVHPVEPFLFISYNMKTRTTSYRKQNKKPKSPLQHEGRTWAYCESVC